MKIAEALTLLSEFPDQVFARYITKEGDFDMEALFLSYNEIEIGEILAKLGYSGMKFEKAMKRLKFRILDYLFDQDKIYKYIDEEERSDAEERAKNDKLYIEPDYRRLIRIIKTLAQDGNYNLNQITIFNAHTILSIEKPPVKTIEELHAEIEEAINIENQDTAKRRLSIWEGQTEEDRNNKSFCKHFLKSMENGDI